LFPSQVVLPHTGPSAIPIEIQLNSRENHPHRLRQSTRAFHPPYSVGVSGWADLHWVRRLGVKLLQTSRPLPADQPTFDVPATAVTFGAVACTIAKRAPRTASGSSGQESISSCKRVSIAPDFAARSESD